VLTAANTMAVGPAALSPEFFEAGLFGPIQTQPACKSARSFRPTSKVRGSRPLLSWKDFLLPELVERSDNGDPSVKAVSSAEQEQQTLQLLEIASNPHNLFYEQRERKKYAQQLRRDSDRANEVAVFERGEGEENFRLWLSQKANRRARALYRKANRLLNCSVTARPMDCSGCGRKGFKRFYCGNRYCRYCGDHVFRRLFAKYIRLQAIVERLMCRDGFRPNAVLATFTFTTTNMDRMTTAEENRKFNQDVRTTLRVVAHELGISSPQFGALWCDEFGGWDPKLQKYNTNLHCHGIWLGPYLPLKLVSAVWSRVRANGDYRVVVQPVPFVDGKPDFARALGHALKYTSKHVSKYSPERLAELELAFNGVRRVHTMGLFYNAPESKADPGHTSTPSCPICGGQLVYPRQCAFQLVENLEKEGRVDWDSLCRKRVIPEEVPS
jgi:hypothetical protein